MAEAVLFTLTNDILNLAGTNILSKIQLVRDARDDLKGLKHTVKTIQTVLLDAEKKQWKSEQVKLWLVRLKDVLYDAQDLLDDVATKDLRQKVTRDNKMSKAVCLFFSKSNQLAQPYKVAKRIQEIRKKLDLIAKDKLFSLEENRSEATVAIVSRRTTDSFMLKDEIIGRQSEKNEIIKHLLDSKRRVSVVSILGMGGLGKTTLARLVYNDDKVRNHFELKMWACVSDFNEDFLIKEIQKSAQGECPADLDMMKNLPDALRGKKYLLVLDDLWNEDRGRWMELHRLLMYGSPGSKILVTTRSELVVRATDENSVIYNLENLGDRESWDLFKKTAFGDGKAPLDPKLVEIGGDIVKKCSGVPLAIKTIGNLLYAKKEKDKEWLYFRDHEFSKINTLNIGIMEVLKISYDHLKPGLKHCFAYCALFPKDYVFNKQTMIQLWMAQGFIESLDENEELEEIGDDYVSNLLCGSFLEVVEVDPYTAEVKKFKLRDLMHDLALKVAGNECKMVSLNKGSIHEDTRHASFPLQSLSLQEVTSLLEATNLRTFLSVKGSSFVEKLSLNEFHGIFSKFTHCRTLSLECADFCIPPLLGSQLKHLRFLEISRNQSIKNLPDSITDLLNLQTLKLSGCENLKTFPRDLRKLVNLRNLSIISCGSLSHLPPLSELPSLKTLSLKLLIALEFLEQTSDPKQSNTTRPFFPSLESLVFDHCCYLEDMWGGRQLVGKYQNHQLGSSKSFFPKLRFMKVINCPKLNFVPPFPQMEYLYIDNTKILKQQLMANRNWSSEGTMESTFVRFPKLEHVKIVDPYLELSILETLLQRTSNLKSMIFYCNVLSSGMQHLSQLQELDIQRSEGLDLSCQEDEQGTQWQSLAKLRVLEISYLSELVALPEWIQHATMLQSLKISYCWNSRSLPEWIGKLCSLEKLVLFDFPCLEYFPSDIYKLTHLKELRIIDCPNLEERYLTDKRIPIIVWEGNESDRLAQ